MKPYGRRGILIFVVLLLVLPFLGWHTPGIRTQAADLQTFTIGQPFTESHDITSRFDHENPNYGNPVDLTLNYSYETVDQTPADFFTLNSQGPTTLEVRIKNPDSSNVTWYGDNLPGCTVHLGTGSSHGSGEFAAFDHRSPLYESGLSGWVGLDGNRVRMQETEVQPGEIATFRFAIALPDQIGEIKEYWTPVVDGPECAENQWMEDVGIHFWMRVFPYCYSFVDRSPAMDSWHTQPGMFEISLLNECSQPWFKSADIAGNDSGLVVHLGTGKADVTDDANPFANQDHNSPFCTSGSTGWIGSDCNRIEMVEDRVNQGEVATFRFAAGVPTLAQSIESHFTPVVEEFGWMPYQQDTMLRVNNNPYRATWQSQEPAEPFTMQMGETRSLKVSFTNEGHKTWQQSNTNLGIVGPDDNSESYTSPFYHSSWSGQDRPAALDQAEVAPGDAGSFSFTVHSPNTPGTYKLRVRPVADGEWWMEEQTMDVYWMITVEGEPVTPTNPTVSVSPLSGAQGTTFAQPGSNFAPNTGVTLFFRYPNGDQASDAATSDGSGNYQHSWTSTCDSLVGTYAYWAEDAQGNRASEVTFSVTENPDCSQTPAGCDFLASTHGYNFRNFYIQTPFSRTDWNQFRMAFADSPDKDFYIIKEDGSRGKRPEVEKFFDEQYASIGDDGNCHGFSSSSLVRFTNHPETVEPNLLDSAHRSLTVHDMPNTRDVRDYIHLYQARQKSREYHNYWGSIAHQTPVEAYQDIKDALTDCRSNPVAVWIFDVNGGGHSMVPFRVEEDGNTGRIYVYDNENPNDDGRSIGVNLETGEWTYDIGDNDWWSNSHEGLHMMPLSLSFPAHLPMSSENVQISARGNSVDLLIRDSQGNALGYQNGQMVSEIPGGFFVPYIGFDPDEPEAEPLERYQLPPGTYQVETLSTATDPFTVTTFFSNTALVFSAMNAGINEQNVMTITTALTGTQIQPSATIEDHCFIHAATIHSSLGRTFDLCTTTPAGETATFTIDPVSTAFHYSSSSDVPSYTFEMEQVGEDNITDVLSGTLTADEVFTWTDQTQPVDQEGGKHHSYLPLIQR